MEQKINNFLGSITPNNVVENFATYELDFICQDLQEFSSNLNEKKYTTINSFLKTYNYKWELYVEDFSFSISQDSFISLEDIIKNEDDINDVLISFKVHKEGNEILIFNRKVFDEFLLNISLEEFLNFFKTKKLPISFISEETILEVGNSTKENIGISKQCNFRNYSQFPFTPNDFFFKEEEGVSLTILSEIVSKLSLIYCLIYIFDTSEITENNVKLIISGNKTIKYKLDFNNIEISLLPFYHKIFRWVYSENNKIEDKIGLARNILVSYLKENDIVIEDTAFISILSANQIYIKGNITKYFEVRNKIIEQIEDTVAKVNKSLDTFFLNFQKSVFTFISYFLGVFIFKIVNKKSMYEKVFTEETTKIGLLFITLSFFFFLISLIIVRIDRKRVKERYDNIKLRYKDVLLKEDIKKILNDDYEYKNEISYFNKRVNWYSCLWILTIVISIVMLYYTSEFLNLKK